MIPRNYEKDNEEKINIIIKSIINNLRAKNIVNNNQISFTRIAFKGKKIENMASYISIELKKGIETED